MGRKKVTGIIPCTKCGQQTREWRSNPDDHPGIPQRRASGLCTGCDPQRFRSRGPGLKPHEDHSQIEASLNRFLEGRRARLAGNKRGLA